MHKKPDFNLEIEQKSGCFCSMSLLLLDNGIISWLSIGRIHLSVCLNFMTRVQCSMMLMFYIKWKVFHPKNKNLEGKHIGNLVQWQVWWNAIPYPEDDDDDGDSIDEHWGDGHLVDLHCDNRQFEIDELALSSIYSFSVDDRNRIHCPTTKPPHFEMY